MTRLDGLEANATKAMRELVAARTEGQTLERTFYCGETVYEADLEYIWRRGWIFVAFTCQIPDVGDFLTFEVGDDSLIVVRGDSDQINAFHNICRHRGSLICDLHHGNTRRFVCPYHQWSYGLNGSLLSAHGMENELKEGMDLIKVHVRIVTGMIFVCLSDTPPDFEVARELIDSFARPQGIAKAKVAKIIDYEVSANWKLVWENNRECYHCRANHPQYIKANFDVHDAADMKESTRSELESQLAKSEASQGSGGGNFAHFRWNCSVSRPRNNAVVFGKPYRSGTWICFRVA